METPFPAIHLYAVLALAATLASVVATHLRSLDYMGQKYALWLAIVTCSLLVVAWGQLIVVLSVGAWAAWRESPIAWLHLTTQLLVIAAMLPIVCVTVIRSLKLGLENTP